MRKLWRCGRSTRLVRFVALIGTVLAGTIVLAACGAAATSTALATGGATQRSEGGQVTVEVTWSGGEVGPVFQVVMDTHAVDLDGYDLRQLAALRTGDGREARPGGWDAPKGGHHREGTLTFPATFADGSPTIGPSIGTVELVIRDVAGVPERTFRWTP